MNFGQQSPFGFGSSPVAGGGGSEVDFLLVTKAQLDTLVGTSALQPGSFYKITDRGDLGILVQATSANTVSLNGVRYMLCPADYTIGATFGARTSIGMWHILKTANVNDLAIWGGLFWVNTSGNIGTADSEVALSAADWTVVAKASFANGEYTPMQFGCQYDYIHDWIQSQWDNKGNVFGVSNAYAVDNGLTYNPVDASDWNIATIPSSSFEQNVCYGFYNNQAGSGAPFFVRNVIPNGFIYHNSVASDITDNTSEGGITGNGATGSIGGFGHIRSNANNGSITDNTRDGTECSRNFNNGSIFGNSGSGNIIGNTNNGSIQNNVLSSQISNNSNNGDISDNQLPAGVIVFNSNDGVITSNTNGGNITNNSNKGIINSNSNTTDIEFNSNDSAILNNSNAGKISRNSNKGTITSNSVGGDIVNNSNAGDVESNANTDKIQFNSNAGNISNNTANVTDISYNSNGGNVSSNNNIGSIANNSNNGDISTNADTITDITDNANNGLVSNNSASVGTVSIFHNVNNGLISGSFAADVTDPVVDKT